MVFGGVFWKAEGCGAEISVAHSRLRQRLERIGPPVLHPVGEPLVLATDLRILDALQGGTGISNREIAALIDRSPRATLGGPLLTAFPQGLYLPSSPQPPAPSPQPPAPSPQPGVPWWPRGGGQIPVRVHTRGTVVDSPCPRLAPPAFWASRPGEPGRILVVGSDLDAQRLRRLLPPAWPMVAGSEPDSVLRELGDASLLCVCSWVGSADSAMWQETARLCSEAGVPILGVPRPGEWHRRNAAQGWSLLGPQNLFLAETDSPLLLSRWVLERSTARFFPALSALGLEGAPRIPLLRAAFRLLTARAQEGEPMASLSEVASALGCHRSTLWRAERSSRVALPEVIRRVRVGFAACRYGGSWGEVSGLLDMTPSGVAHRFRRTLRCTRSDAARKTFAELVLWAAESMVGRGDVLGRVEPEK